jgi:PAS domain S-box-containing protein
LASVGAIKALIVDDSGSDRALVKRALAGSEEEYEIVEATSRDEVEDRLTNENFDLVISDYNILGMDGLGILEVVQNLSPQTPLMLLTGTGSEEVAVAAMKKGAADYIVKSVNHIRKLPAAAAAVLERAALAREREELQEALRRSEEKYRTLIEAATEAVLGVAANGTVSFFSRGAERMFGYIVEEIVGRPAWELASEASREAFRQAVCRCLAGYGGRNAGGILSTTLVGKSGKGFAAEVSLSAPASGAGRGLTVIVRDVTEKRKMEAEIARLERQAAIGEMTAGIAHEVRNPLATIATSAVMVKQELAGAGFETESAEWILESVRKIEGMLTRFFDFAKPLAPECEAHDVNALVREAVTAELAKPAAARVAVEFELSDRLPPVLVDYHLMTPVITNVVANACQAMRGGGNLTIRSWYEDNPKPYVVVTFTDTGAGISPEEAEKALEPFFTTKASGVGLGLPLCLRIVKAHGGEFALVGREIGAEVSVKLPPAGL